MNEQTRGVILYGVGVEAVAAALHDLDPRYVPSGDGDNGPAPGSGQVPVVCRRRGPEADAVRVATPDVAWLVVELYRPGVEVEPAHDVGLWLNTSRAGPPRAARAIDQPDLVTWYEVTDPPRVVTTDGGPVADDYGNIRIVVPEGNRSVAHAVRSGGAPPPCLPPEADLIMPTHDLWMLLEPGTTRMCRSCLDRHR
ncbi:hypothetical protein [Actinoplanes xinjiangensis]|uniref:Uncharacterized protein n=1 Tax=Actinoplanes xinjiangensis TaxID=512350 RepID=A0A316FKT6_9ACTN|nr:hypothetical protein [Actinoplanes xinjiangensis]PWK48326.1 hypothetical protein BC793_106356 [Actinoplanes xinjiangensis]GIF38919.1 hypothetical protein Axi01nite_32300 [Actinoplanes xinjiangensis]